MLLACLAACTGPTRQQPSHGSRQSVRLQQPPDRAAACFARNAEEHSSALAAEVRPGGDRAEVIVRVRNGVLYGTADFRRAGSGSTATITLNVSSMSRGGNLMDELVEGC
ncbi:MAG TPA: hypothetical protein VGP15_15205 [Burkholderiales bacterium]|nr:hypothetical protein [Burkholderiales bacterium]